MVASLTPKAAAKPDKVNLQLGTAAIQAALTSKDQPVFPDMQKNYESYEKNTNDCAASGGTFSIQGCDIPTPAPAPVIYSTPAPIRITQSGNCSSWMQQAGIVDPAIALQVVMVESGCNPNAVNASSGACGIPQALPCSKMACSWGDPVCQLQWMQQYVNQRYGGWSQALQNEKNYGWY